MAVPAELEALRLKKKPKKVAKRHAEVPQTDVEASPETTEKHQLLKRRSKKRKETETVKLAETPHFYSSPAQDFPPVENTQPDKNQKSADEGEEVEPSSTSAKKKGKNAKRNQMRSRKAKRRETDDNLGESNPVVNMQRKRPIEIQSSKNGPLRGMKKWLADYHNKRPGFRVLQQQIDELIADFEDREEKDRKEREAAAAEEGWTVVEHHKGRKKTADLESGIRVVGVASAAAEKSSKLKNKDTALDFYRFQRREARRNEIQELQHRFEEDKKKVAALRAARKFRPF